MKNVRRELERHNAAALAAFEKRLDAEGASEEQKREALGYLRRRLNENAAAWHAGESNENRTVN